MQPEIILAFDTSAAHCAAALLLDGQILADVLEPMEKGQSERLMPLLEELVAPYGWQALTAIAVGTGPGNFTGVRIAVAAARGLALGLGIPAIGVTRLEALAHGLPRPVTVIEDARRNEAYVQCFDSTGPHAARLIAIADSLPDDGSMLTGSAAGAVAPDRVQAPPALPIAHAIARIAASRLHLASPRPAPFYLRGADAAPPSDPPPKILP
ncbi:MAG: tRNA (adenosine(37)-N6)-threonylcarbamoyltransferase complex dimerization subunit type 1 TsaB [Paracoccaceae bacterium]